MHVRYCFPSSYKKTMQTSKRKQYYVHFCAVTILCGECQRGFIKSCYLFIKPVYWLILHLKDLLLMKL